MSSATFSPNAGTDDGYVGDPALYQNGTNGLPTATGGYHVWVRFPNVTIPQGSTINSATIGVKCQTTSAPDEYCAVFANDVNDATYPQTHVAFDAKVLTGASYRWAKGGGWTINNHYVSGDIKTVIQEVVNRSGWASGNAMMLILKHASLVGTKYFYSHDSGAGHITLSVDWNPTAAGLTGWRARRFAHYERDK